MQNTKLNMYAKQIVPENVAGRPHWENNARKGGTAGAVRSTENNYLPCLANPALPSLLINRRAKQALAGILGAR